MHLGGQDEKVVGAFLDDAEKAGAVKGTRFDHSRRMTMVNKLALPSSNAVAITCSIASLAVAFVLVLLCVGLYNRYFVLKMNYDDLKAAMLLHGIDPHPHLPTEEP